MSRFRLPGLTIRGRLTLLYGGLFFAAGALLLGLTYVLMAHSLERRNGPVASRLPDLVALQQDPANKTFAVDKGQLRLTPEQAIFFERLRGDLVQARKEYERDTLNSLLTQGGLALGLVGAAACGLGWLMAGRALRPMHQVTETARRVAASHNLTERIGYTGPRDDVKELADTFDVMLARLARSFDGQRRFVANASHELRTPLAINRTLVDVALRRPDATEDVRRLGDALLVVNTRHERLIDGLLTLAGGENTVIERAPVDLADIAGHVIDVTKDAGAGPDVVARRSLLPAPTSGDPVLLERLVQNLVENAMRHNVPGGEFRVSTGHRDGRAELVVSNTGPVVPPYEVEAAFEPFRRLRTERVGSDRGAGLGLSIVRAIATAHGGEVRAESRPGGGLIVTVRLPG
ncbi:two-component sensor histidine kinase [Actinomadura craniellae]|uniref:histidine kinase n=1 Tax=Actinomadura craniellae TaxID=2231787 RepID=A0A365HBX0_9ACTN|nr:HAMP domain-containing sensor histidine kinase [Actinomadura craniellae]RAY16624.1 two-component sensor histidine kinase [Actinomadura craniellae]